MADLDIKDQPYLGLARLMQLTITAIRYRLMRSLVTTIVITVAVAFVVYMVTTAMAGRGLRELAADDLAELRLADTWATRLTQPPTLRNVLEQWANPLANHLALAYTAEKAGLTEDTIITLHRRASASHALLLRLEELDPISRRVLAGRGSGLALLDSLSALDTSEWESRLRQLRLTRDILAEIGPVVLADWPSTSDDLRTIVRFREEGIRSLAHYFQEPPALQALAEARTEFRSAVQNAGFLLGSEDWGRIQERAAARLMAGRIESGIADLQVRRALAAYLDRQPQDILPSLLWRFLRNHSHAEWYHQQWIQVLPEPPGWTTREAVALARSNRREASLARAVAFASGETGGIAGLGRRTSILVGVSLLVCVVGITNAMLMSVTERYREIATLKCLGALDQSVLWIFVLEALLLGLAGALAGSLLGLLVALGSGLLSTGVLFVAGMPWLDVIVTLTGALLLGAIMSALASVYPSWKAARLPPLEAMRIE